MIKLKAHIMNIPVGVYSLFLAFMILTNILEHMNINVGLLKYILVCSIFILCLKYIICFQKVFEELSDPIRCGQANTFPILLLYLCIYFDNMQNDFLWYITYMIQCSFFIITFYYRFKNKDFNQISPAWIILFNGLNAVAVTGKQFDFPVTELYLYIGIISCLILTLFVFLRIIFDTPLTNNQKPLFAYLVAFPNSCLNTYLNFYGNDINIIFLLSMSCMVIFSMLILGLSLFYIKSIPFSYVFSSYASGFANGTMTIFSLLGYLNFIKIFSIIAVFQLGITIIVLLFFLTKVCQDIFKIFRY